MTKKIFLGIALVAFAVCALAFAQARKVTDNTKIGVVEVKRAQPGVVKGRGGRVIPWHINYQGYLTDDVGTPINATVNMTFSIWTLSSGGSELWNEPQVVTVEDGLFNVVLGVSTPIPSSVFELGESRWLELVVEGQTLSPRTEVTSVGYAYRAVKTDSADYALGSDMVDGFDASATPGPNDLFPLSYGDGQYVNEGQADAISSPMIVDGTIQRADAETAFKAPYADTADYALSAPVVPDSDWTISGSDMYSAVSGNVGIGTATPNPATKLHVSGNCLVVGRAYIGQPDSSESVLDIYNVGVSDWELVAASDADRFDIREWGGSPLLSVEAGGNVGVGTTSPAEKLDVTGTVQMTGFSLPTGATSGYVLTSDVSGQGTWQAAAADNDWAITGNVLHPSADYGLAMRSSNVLHGTGDSTHVNLGVACTTGTSGQNYQYCTVGGGRNNTASERWSTVAGGNNNTASGVQATVGGGNGNTANGQATVGGGTFNTASGQYATVAGGSNNVANSYMATVGGGYMATVQAPYGGVFSGRFNVAGDEAADTAAFVGGGRNNRATARFAAVSGGENDTASGQWATVSGGGSNTASNPYATVGGGRENTASGAWATVGGGDQNRAVGQHSTVAGGVHNMAVGQQSTVGGGDADTASGAYTTVGGGRFNAASGDNATVGGGRSNTADAFYGGVLSGYSNLAGDQPEDTAAVVVGGWNNAATAKHSFVGGGQNNTASFNSATVGGGYGNIASHWYTTVGGGVNNTASGWYATVGGGNNNTAGDFATVSGGYYNIASGSRATVGGGEADTSAGDYSFTVGNNSIVPAAYTNSAAFNGQTATASSQTRVGTISKASGTFTIDHPVDPMNKILNHYFVESPEMVLIYRGVARIGADGRAVVHLPDYFDALNRNPMVQLTGVGTYEVFIADKVHGNRFVIGGKPGTEVYWTVTGDRKDPSAEITRIIMPVEQPKDGDLAGRSLDDDFLATTKTQLEQMGEAGKFHFRTQAGREKYEASRRALQNR